MIGEMDVVIAHLLDLPALTFLTLPTLGVSSLLEAHGLRQKDCQGCIGKPGLSQALRHVYGIPALKMQRQEDHHKFNACMVCIVSSRSMNNCPPQIKTNMVVATHNHR